VRFTASLFLVASWLTFAPAARADFIPSHLVRMGTGLACAPTTMCSMPTDCSAPETCMSVMNSLGAGGTVCMRGLDADIFCCMHNTDCPVIAGLPAARCVPAGGSTSPVPGLCYYGHEYCLGDPTSFSMTDLAQVLACYTTAVPACVRPPPPMMLGTYTAGDCDGDSIPNSSDPMPCVAMPPTCGPDGGMGDGGVTVLDATVGDASSSDLGAATDFGVPPTDLGVPPVDLGVPVDLGAETDADVDLGNTGPDAGPPPMDAATPPPGTSFRGSGGCTCRASGAGDGAAPWSVVALAALAFVRRRQRRQSQR
jgi:MYXO-CTERM domain-containing protein